MKFKYGPKQLKNACNPHHHVVTTVPLHYVMYCDIDLLSSRVIPTIMRITWIQKSTIAIKRKILVQVEDSYSLQKVKQEA